MLSDVAVEVRTANFEAGMLRLEQGVKDGFIEPSYGTLPVQSRLLAEQCQKFTPPSTVGQGRAAVTRDIMGIFTPISAMTWTSKRMRKIIREDNRLDWDAAALNFNDRHHLKGTSAIAFDPAIHKRLRNKRGFINPGDRRNRSVTLGPEAAKARKYLAAMKKLVGYAKSGWNATILRLGGKPGSSWIANHPIGSGRVIVSSSLPDPFVHSINETGWAQYRNREGVRVVQNAILARARHMQTYFERMMKLAADKT